MDDAHESVKDVQVSVDTVQASIEKQDQLNIDNDVFLDLRTNVSAKFLSDSDIYYYYAPALSDSGQFDISKNVNSFFLNKSIDFQSIINGLFKVPDDIFKRDKTNNPTYSVNVNNDRLNDFINNRELTFDLNISNGEFSHEMVVNSDGRTYTKGKKIDLEYIKESILYALRPTDLEEIQKDGPRYLYDDGGTITKLFEGADDYIQSNTTNQNFLTIKSNTQLTITVSETYGLTQNDTDNIDQNYNTFVSVVNTKLNDIYGILTNLLIAPYGDIYKWRNTFTGKYAITKIFGHPLTELVDNKLIYNIFIDPNEFSSNEYYTDLQIKTPLDDRVIFQLNPFNKSGDTPFATLINSYNILSERFNSPDLYYNFFDNQNLVETMFNSGAYDMSVTAGFDYRLPDNDKFLYKYYGVGQSFLMLNPHSNFVESNNPGLLVMAFSLAVNWYKFSGQTTVNTTGLLGSYFYPELYNLKEGTAEFDNARTYTYTDSFGEAKTHVWEGQHVRKDGLSEADRDSLYSKLQTQAQDLVSEWIALNPNHQNVVVVDVDGNEVKKVKIDYWYDGEQPQEDQERFDTFVSELEFVGFSVNTRDSSLPLGLGGLKLGTFKLGILFYIYYFRFIDNILTLPIARSFTTNVLTTGGGWGPDYNGLGTWIDAIKATYNAFYSPTEIEDGTGGIPLDVQVAITEFNSVPGTDKLSKYLDINAALINSTITLLPNYNSIDTVYARPGVLNASIAALDTLEFSQLQPKYSKRQINMIQNKLKGHESKQYSKLELLKEKVVSS